MPYQYAVAPAGRAIRLAAKPLMEHIFPLVVRLQVDDPAIASAVCVVWSYVWQPGIVVEFIACHDCKRGPPHIAAVLEPG